MRGLTENTDLKRLVYGVTGTVMRKNQITWKEHSGPQDEKMKVRTLEEKAIKQQQQTNARQRKKPRAHIPETKAEEVQKIGTVYTELFLCSGKQ